MPTSTLSNEILKDIAYIISAAKVVCLHGKLR